MSDTRWLCTLDPWAYFRSHAFQVAMQSVNMCILCGMLVGCSESRLVSAVSRNDTAEVAKLLNSSANLNEKSMAGETALHIAIRLGNKEIFRMLLEHGSKTDIFDREGASVVHRAAEQNSDEWLKLMVEHGANLELENVGNKHFPGRTPLFYALSKRQSECVKYLISAGASLNHQDARGDTPLIRAVEKGMYSEAILMLSSGADPRIKTKSGESLADLSILQEGNDVVIHNAQARNELVALRQYLVEQGVLK